MASKKIKVGILGATGMVGQRFVSLLENHPWFQVIELAASPRSAGKTYEQAVESRWVVGGDIPDSARNITIREVESDMDRIADEVELVFSALEMEKEQIKKIEEDYASRDVAVVSNNSAHRWTEDVPMMMPEVNPEHVKLIGIQRKNRGWKKGLIAVKPNCSIQSYVPIIKALEKYEPKKIEVTTLQAISGAGKTFESWPEMVDNVIPFIGNEEEKSEKEPMKVLGKIEKGKLKLASKPKISATCIRIAASDGHMASASILLGKKITKNEFIKAVEKYNNPLSKLNLPNAPKQFIKYFNDDNRPQIKLDRNIENGMGIAMGRLRKDPIMGWKFVALSHNTIRGAAGGAILTAELLKAKGYI